MEGVNLIALLITGIIISKVIIAVLIYYLVIKNKALKEQQQKLLLANAKLKTQRDKIINQNKELKSSEEFKTKVLSIASHDLRAPISSMEMLLDFGDVASMSHEDMKKVFAELASQLSISRKMINEILLWTDSQLRQNIDNKEVFGLVDQIQSIAPLFKEEIQRKGIVLMIDIERSFVVYMSKDIFSFVVRNVLSNAVKFCKNNGTVQIGFSSDNNKVKLFVQNEGEELALDYLEKLNSKSSWNYKKNKNSKGGAGLGISLCKDLFKRIGGSIKFENKTGVGLKVNIIFPSEGPNFTLFHSSSKVVDSIFG
ncbi:sensor histidine kinase [Sphingobacterium rhinopitheci]|uniref:sensor histidine kinase n=1 Tax=Sphingobacterium rhinopitheci TaxID=2781960 RepID=UPI001F51CA21|nr:HAMP domain-containing sensor histidine kinase [Sphingobacterium rhinopitheci]MCI0921114.1 HAMP domain-containing histidine kinase [Sphingobacterium rhinopitheci]